MKTVFLKLLRLYIFWLVVFAAARVFFLIYYARTLWHLETGFFEILSVFPHALRLDTATFAYWGLLMLIFVLLQELTKWKGMSQVIRLFNMLFLLLYLLMAAGDTGLYAEWQTKLNYKALRYLANPGEVVGSTPTSTLVFLIAFVAFFWYLGYRLYNYFVFSASRLTGQRWWLAVLAFATGLPLLVIGARGGLQEIPINQSQSYFSRHDILNQASVNTAFNLYISWFENRQFRDSNPFVFMDDARARQLVDSLFAKPLSPPVSILKTNRPNVVMLILESWSADLIESLGGEPGITPEFSQLEKEGMLFTRAYAGGKRSEQGLAAIFSAFPPHPYTSITVQPDKYRHLPSIVRKLNGAGYHSSFYFGGQLIYGNIKSYIIHNNFARIKEIYDFKQPGIKGKLGIHDEFTLREQLRDLATEPRPFFSALFTLSSHSPYDQPMEEKLAWGGNERRYINSAYYTDWCLGRYFEEARRQPWYPNTLFVLVADHSHNSYRNWHPNTFEYNRIPILFYGDVIKEEFRGTVSERLVSQTDLGTTLLAMLGLSVEDFFWGRDMLNPATPDFTYLTFDYGMGWKVPQGEYIWDHGRQIPFVSTLPPGQHLHYEDQARAFLQVLFAEYLRY